MSLDVAEKLFEGVFEMPLFHIEDVYITGILAKHKNITLTKSNMLAFSSVYHLCKLKGLISEHGRSDEGKFEVMNFIFSPAADECELLGLILKYCLFIF